MMTFQITLSEQDYLSYYLYNSLQSKTIQYRCRRAHYLYGILMLVVALSFYVTDDEVASAVFLVMGVSWLCFFPLFTKGRIRKAYLTYVRQNFNKCIGKPSTVEITDDHIRSVDDVADLNMSFKGISDIVDTNGYFYIRTFNNLLFIIPKSQVDSRELGEYLGRIASWHSIKLTK